MPKTDAERMRDYRNRKRNAVTGKNVTRVTKTERNVTDISDWPVLPPDPIIAANATIEWVDVLAMPRDQIDCVYRAWCAVRDDILLRLRRAAGYHLRQTK